MSQNNQNNPEPVAFRGRLAFCSNFYPVYLMYKGIRFATSEHAFQWAKCKNQEDKDKVIAAISPSDAKMIGKKVVLVDNWDHIRIGIMKDILEIKFGSKYMAGKLLETGDEELVEVNTWHDYFWGVCNGEGKNWLGKILMQIREDLKNKK